ncbi:MAG TPA: DUF1361 domain-containing protein [Anaeromyxobacteraceae bacterium]|nr:DUF1361 domain-containing protein [Anaeromyxobacteraceae bacterium]
MDRVIPPAPCRGRLAAVSLASALALSMWAARAGWAGPRLLFLVWNLGLAWVPWLAARALSRASSAAGSAALGALWLLFLPNAPYLVTDLVHLRARPPVPPWFDLLLFAGFGLAGCALAWASIEIVHARLALALGRARAATAIAVVLFLTGFGVYLGRFLRWNSWDVVSEPGALLAGAAAALASPRALAFSALFGAFVGAGYLAAAPRIGPLSSPAATRSGPAGPCSSGRSGPPRR